MPIPPGGTSGELGGNSGELGGARGSSGELGGARGSSGKHLGGTRGSSGELGGARGRISGELGEARGISGELGGTRGSSGEVGELGGVSPGIIGCVHDGPGLIFKVSLFILLKILILLYKIRFCLDFVLFDFKRDPCVLCAPKHA